MPSPDQAQRSERIACEPQLAIPVVLVGADGLFAF